MIDTKLNKAELGINWEDYIIPSEEQKDVKIFHHILKEDYGYTPVDHQRNKTEHTIFNGTVGLKEYPYKSDSTVPCPLDNPTIDLAVKSIKDCWPEMYAMISGMLDYYWPTLPADRINVPSCGCTCGIYGYRPYNADNTDPAKMQIGVQSSANGVPAMLEGIVHELGHHKLHTLGWDLEDYPMTLIANKPDEVFHSPVRFDKLRPMSAVIHAEFSYLYVTEYYNKQMRWMIDNTDNLFWNEMHINNYLSRNSYNLHRIGNGIHTIRAEGRFTEEGQKLIDVMLDYGVEVWYRGYEILKEMDVLEKYDYMPENGEMP